LHDGEDPCEGLCRWGIAVTAAEPYQQRAADRGDRQQDPVR